MKGGATIDRDEDVGMDKRSSSVTPEPPTGRTSLPT